MKATRQLVNFIIIAFLILMGFSIAMGYFLFIRKFLMLEEREIIARMESVKRSFVSEKEHLTNACRDWAIWEDAWLYLRDENPDFPESNLSLDSLLNLNLNLMSFVRPDGSVKWQMEVDIGNETQITNPDFPDRFFPEELLAFLGENSDTGLVTVGLRVFLLVSNPVLNGSQSTEKASGFLVVGRELTPPVITRLSEMTNVDFQVSKLSGLIPSLSPKQVLSLEDNGRFVVKEKKHVTSYSTVNGSLERSSDVVLIISHSRDLMQLGWNSFILYLIVALSGVLAVAFGVLRYMNLHYFFPVRNLYQNVLRIKEEGALSFRIPVNSDNEFGRLCESFNSLLDVIQNQTNELSRKNLYLNEQANTDELTGLFNKRFYRTWLDSREYSSHPAEEVRGVFIMLDIDHFKLYNDRYGHIAGDVCLRSVAAVLKKIVTRNTDFSCRYGGEEFLLILENTDCPGAERVAQKIAKGIKALKIENADSPTSSFLTVSIGISSGSFTSSSKVLEQLILSADEALYISKKNGRDRYSFGSC